MIDTEEGTHLGLLVSDKITWSGFFSAMFDVIFLGAWLSGALAIATNLKNIDPSWIHALLLGLMLLFMERFLYHYWRVMHPLDNYQSEQTFTKEDGTITRLVVDDD